MVDRCRGRIVLASILVTGGAGLIGSHLVDALVGRGEQVTVLDALTASTHPSGSWPDHLPAGVRRVRGDVRERETWTAALLGADRVVHAAALQDYRPEYSAYYAVNAAGTALLYELLRERAGQVRRVLVVSTQAVYGEGRYRCADHADVFPGPRAEADLARGDFGVRCPSCARPVVAAPTREMDPTRPLTVYGLSKLAGEAAALRIGRMIAIPTVAARLSITIGPRQSPANLYSGALRNFAVSLLHNEPVNLFEDGGQLRDFVPVADVVRALVLLLDRDDTAGRTINVGGGAAVPVRDLLAAVEDAVGRRARGIVHGYYRVGETRDIVSDVTALRDLGWERVEDLGAAVMAYVRWLRDSGSWKVVRPVRVERLLAEGTVRPVIA